MHDLPDVGDLQHQTDTIASSNRRTKEVGILISTKQAPTAEKYSRLNACITTPSVRTNGLLLFTTFKPTADICGFGGETMFWLLNYATGAAPPPGP